jgi:ribonucleoside-diphosphate reductase alpha chain
VPFLRTLDSSVAAVNQGGRRKGAACVYLEPWHPDIEEFLELRDNTGEDARRTHNLNLANWIPDEFMRRVEADQPWSLFDPDQVPELPDLWGDEFDAAYRAGRGRGPLRAPGPARELYGRMMRTLAQTGNGWMTFKDASNRLCNQTAQARQHRAPVEPVHRDHRGLLRRRDRRLQPRLDQPGRASDPGARRRRLGAAARDGAHRRPFLDRVIDINYYPSEQTAASNPRWRPVGLGVMGLQDVFFALRLPFDDARGASELSTRISEEIYLTALESSADLARRAVRRAPAYADTRAASRRAAARPWGVRATSPELTERWTRCGPGSRPPACATRC